MTIVAIQTQVKTKLVSSSCNLSIKFSMNMINESFKLRRNETRTKQQHDKQGQPTRNIR